MTVRNPLAVQGCLEACERCETLLELIDRQEHSLAEAAYRAIGPHLRHCLDHFTCLLRGIDSGRVDYDGRDREERLERDRSYFRSALSAVVARLREIDTSAIRSALKVQQSASSGGHVVADSNLERELVFLSGHTIHHLAIMKLLAEAAGLRVPDDLSIAFSTAAARVGDPSR